MFRHRHITIVNQVVQYAEVFAKWIFIWAAAVGTCNVLFYSHILLFHKQCIPWIDIFTF